MWYSRLFQVIISSPLHSASFLPRYRHTVSLGSVAVMCQFCKPPQTLEATKGCADCRANFCNECFKLYHPWGTPRAQHEHILPTLNFRPKARDLWAIELAWCIDIRALDASSMSMIVYGLRSWPARSTTRRNYSSIAEPVSGYSALCANYAAFTPDTKFCQWSMRIKPWRYWFPALSTIEMGGTHFAGCISKIHQFFSMFYTQKSCVTLFVSEQNKVTHSLNRTETFVSVKFSQWYNRHFRTCHVQCYKTDQRASPWM